MQRLIGASVDANHTITVYFIWLFFISSCRQESLTSLWRIKLAFHDADTDTDTDTDILVDILVRIVARMSACRSSCHKNYLRKSRVSDVSARILARMSVSVSASWNSSLSAYSRECAPTV